MAIETGIGPTDLLATPPEVFDAIVEELEARQRERKRQEQRERLKRLRG